MEEEIEGTIWERVLDIAYRSPCKKRKVGCLIVNETGEFISLGYNHNTDWGVAHCENDENETLISVIHAEDMAAQEIPEHLRGTELYAYVSHEPCKACRQILNTVCKEIFVKDLSHKYNSPFHELFYYKAGKLYNKEARGTTGVKDAEVGTKMPTSYLVCGEGLVHRIIYEMFNGEIPEGMQIDHIDHNRSNNNIDNLRLVTNQENSMNRKIGSDNKSGVVGVRWREDRQKWRAQITIDGKAKHLGSFDTIEEATAVRKEAEQELGFHENHGVENPVLPNHYADVDGVPSIKFFQASSSIEQWRGYCKNTAMKYLYRLNGKEEPQTNAKKCKYFIDKLVESYDENDN